MKKEIIYRTQISVKGILTKDSFAERRVSLIGVIKRCTERKLLGCIPLPDCYKHEVTAYEFVETGKIMTLLGGTWFEIDEDKLTFESKKRLAEERQNLEAWLRGKCNEYKKKYGTGWK